MTARRALTEGWQACAVPPGAFESPADVDGAWIDAPVPGTFAQALAATGEDALSRSDLDALDVWYRTEFTASDAGAMALHLQGLATLADVYLNGELLLSSHNMFVAHRLEIADRVQPTNTLAIHFRALATALKQRRPRPRYKTRLVAEQNLRWVRTTLLGRIPGWSPPCTAVGPWRAVELVESPQLDVTERHVLTDFNADTGAGSVTLSLQLAGDLRGATASLHVAGGTADLQVQAREQGATLSGELKLDAVDPWWPHTHGEPRRYPAHVEVKRASGSARVELGELGFRCLAVRGGVEEQRFVLSVNGRDLFCRGACWTTADMLALDASEEALRHTLTLARDAGVNMLRVGGTMVYESDAFYALCDELGILVWQDFMFANMDYPHADEAFAASVDTEARQQLARIAPHPCLAVLCGGSEVAQQAAMLGLPRDGWLTPLFEQTLPALCETLAPGVPYVASTPIGGVLPFHLDRGVGHYFGVGAYLRPPEDAALCTPRFAAECLSFSIPPEDVTLHKLLSAGQAPGHDPVYKERVPRDSGAGWDFQDVTDHYVTSLFDVDVRALRYENPERYVELSRVVVGELFASSFGHWRKHDSACSGALLWFYRDLWAGAGWGMLDSRDVPKAPYYYFRRSWAPVAAWFEDRGLNGLTLWLDNETSEAQDGRIELTLLRDGDVRVDGAEHAFELAPGAQHGLPVETLLGHFADVTHAYRFGPAGSHVIWARIAREGEQDVTTFHFPAGHAFAVEPASMLQASAVAAEDGTHTVTVRASRFAQAVNITAKGYLPEDNYFHMAPGTERTVVLTPVGKPARFAARAKALNSSASTRIAVQK